MINTKNNKCRRRHKKHEHHLAAYHDASTSQTGQTQSTLYELPSVATPRVS